MENIDSTPGNWVEKGVHKKLLKFDRNRNNIYYVKQNIKRSWKNPEEWIQAESFVKLILLYKYSPSQIKISENITIGSKQTIADIIVYTDEGVAKIVVECKKEDISPSAFNRAIEQAFSYAATGTVRAEYFWVTSKIRNDCFRIPLDEPKKYIEIADIPMNNDSNIVAYKFVKGGNTFGRAKYFDLDIVSEEELTRRFKHAHNALWGGGELNPSTAFDELDKLIFCKLWDEQKNRKAGEPYDFQIFTKNSEEETNNSLQERILSLYEEGRRKEPEVFKENIRLGKDKIRSVVSYLESIDLGRTDLDSKGRAFETFLGSFFRGDFGQFFTPRPIVKFVVDVLPITNESMVLDTSCGSGGFLLHALDKVRKQAKSLFSQEDKRELIKGYKYWHDFAKNNLYGIEINEQIARTAKMNMIIHDDGHTNVIAADGLIHDCEINKMTNNYGFKYGSFDIIMTNPPFGSKIHQVEKAYFINYKFTIKDNDWLEKKNSFSLRDRQSTEILFIEQCYNYLKEGGYLAIVIPDGILTNRSLQYVRDSIDEMFRIVAVISLPRTAFQSTGAGVKSSILFLKKSKISETNNIRDKKFELQNSLLEEFDYFIKLDNLKKIQKQQLNEFIYSRDIESNQRTTVQDSSSFFNNTITAKEINFKFKEEVEILKTQIFHEYTNKKQQIFNDYSIFMALAEEIGYDASGRTTNKNELEDIGVKLKSFINDIERGTA